jgi:hypothetical protein
MPEGDDAETLWKSYEDGATVGQAGSESGVILLDEEHSGGARITLERDCGVAAYAITCGIYGEMMHTRFFSDTGEANREFNAMKAGLSGLVTMLESAGDTVAERSALNAALDEFMGRFP